MRGSKGKQLVGVSSTGGKEIKDKLLSLLSRTPADNTTPAASTAATAAQKNMCSPESLSEGGATAHDVDSELIRVASIGDSIPTGSNKSGGVESNKEILTPQRDKSASSITRKIRSILGGSEHLDDASFQQSGIEKPFENILSIPWFTSASTTTTSQRRREIRMQRKAKWVTKNTQTRRFDRLVKLCAEKLGAESTFEILSKLGRETGTKECNSLIGIYINEARKCKNEDDILIQIQKVHHIFKFMTERGFQIEEATYSPLFEYLIDMKMTQEFHFLCEIVRRKNPRSCVRMDYYEMLLYIKVGDECKIQNLCRDIEVRDKEDGHSLAESYLLAFCDSDRKEELLRFFEDFDIRRISSLDNMRSIFKSLGRLSLEVFAEDFISSLKATEAKEGDISLIIYDYATSMPNSVVEEIVSKFIFLHEQHAVPPSAVSYGKIVTFCCNSFEVHIAIDLLHQMPHFGLIPTAGTFQPMLCAIEQSGEFDLVRSIFSVLKKHKVIPKEDVVKTMINSFTRMIDFSGAYDVLSYLLEMKKMPTSSMFNAILTGYFRENDTHGALMALKKMEDASVTRDAETFSILITNCKCEKDIVKYHSEMSQAGINPTRRVFIALINAYANCGNFEKAKQVLLDYKVPIKDIADIKSVLLHALASNGRVLDALEVYDDIKQAGNHPQPRAILCLIEHLRSEGELERLLQLLGELNDSRCQFDASGRIFLYCVRHNFLSSALDLLKSMKKTDMAGTLTYLDQAFSQLWERGPTNLETGLELLRLVKEELHIFPSRISLDFLLSACVKARDLRSAQLIWAEYSISDLPLNGLSFLRMYQVLLASEDFIAAEKLLKKIPKDDAHIRIVIDACRNAYCHPQIKKMAEE